MRKLINLREALLMFRANEESEKLRVEAFDYLLMKESFPWRKDNSGTISTEDRKRSEHALSVIYEKIGPVITSYPEWHPINASGYDKSSSDRYRGPQTTPIFPHLDHTRYFANGFITCPYGGTDELIAAVDNWYSDLVEWLSSSETRFNGLHCWLLMALSSFELHASYITDELISSFTFDNGAYDYALSGTLDDVSDLIPFYASGAKPVLVWWDWNNHKLEPDGTIPPSIAVPFMLARSLADISEAEVAESWEDMRYLLLGSPHGARSSLLLNQLTVKQLRTMFNGLMDSGAFGPQKQK